MTEMHNYVVPADKAKSYFRRYWGLQADQFDYYIDEFLDENSMVAWAYTKIHDFQSNIPRYGTCTLSDSWNNVGKISNRENHLFVEYIDFLESLSKLSHGQQDRDSIIIRLRSPKEAMQDKQ